MRQNEFILNNIGKKILITAGIHGNQHSSVLLGQRLAELIKNKDIKPAGIKSITIINFINQYGIYSFRRQNQNDIDLNRQFSQGKSTIKEIQYIKKKIKQVDIVIDLHSSINSTEFFYLNNDRYLASYVDFLNKNELAYVINQISNDTVKTYANSLGKLGFTFEMNQSCNSIDEVSVIRSIIYLKKLLNSISKLTLEINNNINYSCCKNIQMPTTGRLKVLCQLGKIVDKDQVIAYINNGERTINVLSPCKGIIIAFPIRYGYISIGSPIIAIQPL